MLQEINGVLQRGYIRPGNFRIIQQQATSFDQLQQKFAPPKLLSTSTAEIDIKNIDTSKLPRIRVMNRGVEEATAVLVHYGWSSAQIHTVLKSISTPLENIGFTLINDWEGGCYRRYRPTSRYRPTNRKLHYPYHLPIDYYQTSKARVFKSLLMIFGLGVFTFMGVLLILHML